MQLLTLQKKILGPVHLLPKTDKWDYLQRPIIDFFFVSCFDIGEVPRSPGNWNWNLLYFFPFIFTFEQCGLSNFPLNMSIKPVWVYKCNPKWCHIPLSKLTLYTYFRYKIRKKDLYLLTISYHTALKLFFFWQIPA